MTPEELQDHTETLSLINEEITARLDRQSDALEKIDGKAGLVVGYAFAAASFLATRNAQPVIAALAYLCFGVAAAVGVAVLAVSNFQDIEPAALLSYADRTPARTLAALASRRVMIFRFNTIRQQAKARRWWISFIAALAGTVLMVVAILVHN